MCSHSYHSIIFIKASYITYIRRKRQVSLSRQSTTMKQMAEMQVMKQAVTEAAM